VIKVYDEVLKVTVSIGVSTFPDNALNMQNLIEMADQALYLAKETGKNKVCFSST
jgi:diguanylate cyclase